MKILYDHQIFSIQNYGGISRYFSELIGQLDMSDVSVAIPPIYTNNYYANALQSNNRYHFKKYDSLIGHIIRKQVYRHNTELSRRLLLEGDFDVFHPTYYEPYFLDCIGDKPFIITIYDMIHEIFPEYFPADEPIIAWKRELAKRASRIIAISENTKKDLIKFCDVDSGKVTVIHLGNSLMVPDRTKPFSAGRHSQKYLLFVGDRSLYKNFYLFAESIAPLLKADPELRLVCAGKPFSEKERAFFRHIGLDGKVEQSQASDAALADLYQRALAFVYPSLYEGFGIPVLEAFSCGCPALLSNTSSLPEVGGDAAIYFNPKDAVSIRDAVIQILNNRGLREEMIARGRERLARFSWDKCARETISVYRSLLE